MVANTPLESPPGLMDWRSILMLQQKLKDPTRHVGNESLFGKSPAAARRGIGGIGVPSIKGRKTQQNKNVDIYKSLMRLRSKVLLGESRAALIHTMEELVEMVNVNGGKVLMVDCKEEGCVEDIPNLWKRVQLTRDAGLFQLSVDGDFILEKKEFTAMISSQLLPVAYSFAPDLVVLRSSSLPPYIDW